MKSKQIILLTTFLVLLTLAACEGNSENSDDDSPPLDEGTTVPSLENVADEDQEILPMASCGEIAMQVEDSKANYKPFCPDEHYDSCGPKEYEIISPIKPDFKWVFPYLCTVSELEFVLVELEYKEDGSYGFVNESPPKIPLDTSSTHYARIEELSPGTEYLWNIRAYDWVDGKLEFHSTSDFFFWTGPICDANTNIGIELISPTNGEIAGSLGTALQWKNDGLDCIPESYRLDLAKDPASFGENDIGGAAGYPTIHWNLVTTKETETLLEDCTQYFWRVAAFLGQLGPFSETFTFYVNDSGDCDVPIEFLQEAYVVAPQNTNCRASDYTDSKNLVTLMADQPAEIIAINPEGTHIRILEPEFEIRCWVWLGLVDLMLGPDMIDPALLPDLVSIERPPTLVPPTETPTPIPLPECSDGIDNDGDGDTDMSDGRCTSPDDDSEST